MAFSLVGQNGKAAYGVKNYVLDAKADLDNLPISGTPGSTAFVIEENKTYILGNEEKWVATSASSGGGGSQGGEDISSISNEEIDSYFTGEEEYVAIANEEIDAYFEEEF